MTNKALKNACFKGFPSFRRRDDGLYDERWMTLRKGVILLCREAVEDPLQLFDTNPFDFIRHAGPLKCSTVQSFDIQPQPRTIPLQNLHRCPGPVAEHEHGFRIRIQLVVELDDEFEALEPFSQISRTTGKVHFRARVKIKHTRAAL